MRLQANYNVYKKREGSENHIQNKFPVQLHPLTPHPCLIREQCKSDGFLSQYMFFQDIFQEFLLTKAVFLPKEGLQTLLLQNPERDRKIADT